MTVHRTPKPIDNQIIAYVVVWAALILGFLATAAMGQTPATDPQGIPRIALKQEPGTGNRWILGIQARPTETGYVVQSVLPNTAAQRIGLERGDRILAVNQDVVGYVGNRLSPLRHALDRNGHQNGRVRLLVQNCRNQRILSLRVTLKRPLEHLGH